MVSSEFGRTPKINKDAGRDHWPKVFSVVLAGGGIKEGAIYGSSNATASEPERDPIGPEDLATTVYHLLGIVADKELMAPATGRSRSSTAARSSRICSLERDADVQSRRSFSDKSILHLPTPHLRRGLGEPNLTHRIASPLPTYP